MSDLRLLKTLAVCFLLHGTSFAAFDLPALSARHAAFFGSLVAYAPGQDSFFLNPALTGKQERLSASLSYAKLYNIYELGYSGGRFSFPWHNWGIGAFISKFGSALYAEQQFSLSLARIIDRHRLRLGLTASAYVISASGYGRTQSWGISTGLYYEMLPTLHLGAAIENLNSPRFNGHTEELSRTMRLGISYRPDPLLQAQVAIEKDRWYAPELSISIEYQLYDRLALMTGYTTRSDIPAAGFSLTAIGIEISYALQHHFELGETHFFSFSYQR